MDKLEALKRARAAKAEVDALRKITTMGKTNPPKAKSDPVKLYDGGVVLPEVKTGPVKKASQNLTDFQEACKAANLDPAAEVVNYWKANAHSLTPEEARKFLAMMLEYTTPKVKSIEGQVQVDGNVTVNIVYFGEEKKPDEKVVEVESEKTE